jgi:hypothetical protein
VKEYDIRKGFQDKTQPENLKALMKEIFGNAEEKEGKILSSYGGLKELAAWPSKKTLFVDTKMDPSVANDVARQTIEAYNTFLERATGYTSKERGKRIQKKAKEGKL